MERQSAQADVHRLFEQLFDLLDKPDLNRVRDSMRELSDEISTLYMVHREPGAHERIIALSDLGLSKQLATLIVLLSDNLGKTFSKEAILDACRPAERRADTYAPSTKLAEVNVSKARSALRKHSMPYHIENVWGIGYRMIALENGAPRTNHNGGRSDYTQPRRAEAERLMDLVNECDELVFK